MRDLQVFLAHVGVLVAFALFLLAICFHLTSEDISTLNVAAFGAGFFAIGLFACIFHWAHCKGWIY